MLAGGLEIEVLHQDGFLIIVNKPSGMLVHRGWGRDDETLVDWTRRWTGLSKIHPIHRLDRGTSGVVLIGLDAAIARDLAAQLDRHTVMKSYLALVRGRTPKEGIIDHPIPRREGGPRVEAVTSFARLMTVETEPRHTSLVHAKPQTGRLHQIRRHLKHISHPLIGDANYGKGPLNRAFRQRYGLSRLALHALSLSFDHPETGQRMQITAPLPDDLRDPFSEMGIDIPGDLSELVDSPVK